MSFFITEGAEIDAIDGDGNTPLHISVRGGRKEICRVLLEKNARSNIKNYDKNTPLHLAVENNSPDIVRMLVVEHSELINIRVNFFKLKIIIKLKIETIVAYLS